MLKQTHTCDKCGRELEKHQYANINFSSSADPYYQTNVDLCPECAAPYLKALDGLSSLVKK